MNALLSVMMGRPVSPAASPNSAKTSEPVLQFEQLLMGLSTGAASQASPGTAAEALPEEELMALFEQLMVTPTEQLTEEQQALQYAVFQLLGDANGEQLQLAIEAYSAGEEMQAELAALVKQLQSLMTAAKEFAQPDGFSGVALKEMDLAEAAPEETLRPLIELAAQLIEETPPSEKVQVVKELMPVKPETRLPFAQTPAFLLQALTQESAQADSAVEQQAPDVQAMPAEELVPEAEAVQAAAPAKTEGQAQAAVLPAAFAEQKPVDAQVRQVPVQNLSETLAEWVSSPARLAAGGNETRLRINIFPEHLGHLEILVSTASGKVSAQIIASHGAAKEAVELQLNQLRLSLSQQGVEIDRLEVREDSGSMEFQQREQQQSPFSNAPKHTASQGSGSGGEAVSEEADLPQKRPRESGSANGQVDYSV
ncbi:flagellar hook-length control protein FliK [Planococcus maritimus]|uniref:flagellar hook-length control protein FliK n=1 Tax=Planococcus maritimus TaxID=192421 RepID=UPI0031388A32